MEQQAILAMTRARAALVLDHPFFGSVALRLTLRPDPACRDLWTDGRTLGFNPSYAVALSEASLIGAQAHEIMHLACGHHVRRGERDATLWNKACDFVVNQLLLDAGFSLPQGAPHDPAYTGLSAEALYAGLARLQEEAPNEGAEQARMQEESKQAEGGAGQGGGEGEGEPEESDGPTEGERGEAELSSGRGSAGESRDDGHGDKAKHVDFTGEVRDHPVLDGSKGTARKKAEQEADIELVQAMQRSLHMGDMPADFLRLLRKRLHPTLDWKGILQRFLENCTDGDSTWTTPNRRYLYQSIYLPSRREPRIPHIVLAVDSSGSVDDTLLEAFCGELSGVLESYDTILTVLFHDTRVQSARSFTRQDLPLRLSPTGGGGTDYRPVTAYIEENDLEPTCLIWFTDLECSRFPEEPPFPVLWLAAQPNGTTPPFGETAYLKESPPAPQQER